MPAENDTYDVTAHLINGTSVRYQVPRDEMAQVFATLQKPDAVLVFQHVAEDNSVKHYVPVRTVVYIEQSYA
jgi:hypothetical protein